MTAAIVLSGIYIACELIANVTASKPVAVGGIVVPAAVFIYALTFTLVDLINDHLNRIWNTLEEAKETVEIYKDTDYVLSQDRLQKIMAVLTVIMAVMLPFSIISSIYGMNVPLPGSGAQGHPQVGWILIAIMTLAAGVMVFFFRRRRWI